jgi:hypothetical protein
VLPQSNATVFKMEVHRLLGASDFEMENSPFSRCRTRGACGGRVRTAAPLHAVLRLGCAQW